MVEESNTSTLPARYRIGLALSLALLLHTLLFSGIPSPVSEQKAAHRESVQFELVSPGTIGTTRPSPESTTTSAPTSTNPGLNVEPVEPIIARRMPDLSDIPEQIASDPPAPTPETSGQPGRSTASTSDPAEAMITRITNSPVEQDPYVVVLATHLGRQLEQGRVPAMRNLSRAVAMEVELQLLGNGALTRARVLKSTGIEGIDEAAYRAALAASPYPRPPGGGNSQNRFEVELVFTPKRL